LIKLSVETKNVLVDLQALQKFDINAYGRVAALIRELHANQGTEIGQNLIDQLNMQGRDIDIGSKMIGNSLQIMQEKLHRNIWRLKLWTFDHNDKKHLEPYRVIYGFFPASQFRKVPEIRILAVPCRKYNKEDSYDYQPTDTITIRFRSDYDNYK